MMSLSPESHNRKHTRHYSSHNRRSYHDDDDREYDRRKRRKYSDYDRYDDDERDRRKRSDDRRRSRTPDKRRSRRYSEESSYDSEEFEDEKFDELRKAFKKYIRFEREVFLDDDDATEMMKWNTLPCFDRIHDFEGIEMRKKFFEDVKEGDMLACKVLEVNDNELDLKPECTMNRYRRCLYRIPFPITTVVAACETELIACRKGDIISATVIHIDHELMKLYLNLNNYGIPLKDDELPAYYRKLPELTYDDPELIHKLGLRQLRTTQSLHKELIKKRMDNPKGSAEALQLKALEQKAADLVKEAATVVKEGKNKEGIEIFKKALEVVPNFVPALTGRAAAYANEKMFREALKDLRIAKQLDPDDETSTAYLSTVLMVYGQEKEESGALEEAKELYEEAIQVSDDTRARILFREVEEKINRIKNDEIEKKKDKEDRKKEKEKKKERKENSKKLKEMEKFIESLKRDK